MDKKNQQLLNIIAQTIFDKKGWNIITFDVTKLSLMASYVMIAEGNVARHVKALSGEIIRNLKEVGEQPVQVEGKQNGDWIVLDYSNIVVHLVIPDMREKYQLETLWSDGEIIDLNIDISKDQQIESL